jgi:hypothetical protein
MLAPFSTDRRLLKEEEKPLLWSPTLPAETRLRSRRAQSASRNCDRSADGAMVGVFHSEGCYSWAIDRQSLTPGSC